MKKMKKVLTAILLTALLQSCEKKEDDGERGAGTGCECVGYVKNVIGIPSSTSTADALGWGRSFTIPNYYEVSGDPRAGDIVVMDKGYQWGHPEFGHIGFVKSFSYTGGNLNILVHGARQQSGYNRGAFDECGCRNVDDLDVVNITPADRLNGRLRIYRNNTPTYCSSFDITGTLSTSTPSLDFGAVNITVSSTQNITLANTGGTGVYVSGVTAPQYFGVAGGGFNIPAGATVQVPVKFSPQQAGSYSGNVTFASNATNGTFTVPVSGSGVVTVPPAGVTSSPLPGVFVPCPSGPAYNGTGGCSSLSFNNGVVKCRLRNPAVENGQLVFEIVKCDGSNFQSGKAYMKKGDVCGIPLPAAGQTYNGGSVITIYVPIDFLGTQQFTCVIDPDNYAANYRFAGGSVFVTRL
jgi:hypothetical protein